MKIQRERKFHLKSFVALLAHLWGMPLIWRLWVGLLGGANMAAFFYLPRLEAWVVLLVLACGMFLQTLIFQKWGFVRLLGLAHGPWLVMLPWLYTRLSPHEHSFNQWIRALVLINSLSLIIDVVDVVRFGLGDRKPTVVL